MYKMFPEFSSYVLRSFAHSKPRVASRESRPNRYLSTCSSGRVSFENRFEPGPNLNQTPNTHAHTGLVVLVKRILTLAARREGKEARGRREIEPGGRQERGAQNVEAEGNSQRRVVALTGWWKAQLSLSHK
jgi:hypothetical protein